MSSSISLVSKSISLCFIEVTMPNTTIFALSSSDNSVSSIVFCNSSISSNGYIL